MKVNPISVVMWQRFDHMLKTVFTKNEQNGNVRMETESFPLYNNKGKMIEPASQGSKVDLKA
jgi:hypothetical protein